MHFSDLSEPGGPVEILTGALSGIRVIKFFAGSLWPNGPVVRVQQDRNTAAAGAQREDTAVARMNWPLQPSHSREPHLVAPRVRGERIKGDVWFVALAYQDPQGAVAVATAVWRRWEAAGQQLQRAVQLRLVRACAGAVLERRRDRLLCDPALQEGTPDPLSPPLLEFALVGNEQVRETMIIEVPVLGQLGDRLLCYGVIDALAEQVGTYFAGSTLSPV